LRHCIKSPAASSAAIGVGSRLALGSMLQKNLFSVAPSIFDKKLNEPLSTASQLDPLGYSFLLLERRRITFTDDGYGIDIRHDRPSPFSLSLSLSPGPLSFSFSLPSHSGSIVVLLAWDLGGIPPRLAFVLKWSEGLKQTYLVLFCSN
jgi:hypothetical protein